MAVVDIKRIIIGFLESEREAVVSALKRLGTVHIDDMFPILVGAFRHTANNMVGSP